MPKILLFGAGFVAGPFVDHMLERPENVITIASRSLERAQKLARGRKNIVCVKCDVTSATEIDNLVKECDIAVSLVPYIYHANIIDACVRNGKNFCSTSYVSPAMKEFDMAAKEKNLIIMNEIGVDPGVDHLYAKKIIDQVHDQGGKVKLFESYCGGLPAPECSDNPLGYKFSWSPRGVLLAVRNEGKFKKDGKVVTIPGPELLRKGAKPIFIYPAFATVGYPNRDSSFYDERYNMPECETVVRGSLRYQGNVELVQCWADIGFLNLESMDYLAQDAPPITWIQVLAKMMGCSNANPDIVEGAIRTKACLGGEVGDQVIQGMKWFGLFSNQNVIKCGSLLDTLCHVLMEKLQFQDNERDMVLLQHKFIIEWKDGSKETRYCRLLEYGQAGGTSAMARLVGMPCGVATQLILDGKITETGVFAPLSPEIYNPLIEAIEAKGVVVKHTSL